MAAHEPGLIIIGAEVSGAWVGDIDGDKGNIRFEVFGSDVGGDDFVGLKFDGEVNLLADEIVGAAKGDFGLIAIVDGNEFYLFPFSGALEAGGDFAVEGGVLALFGIAYSVKAPTADFGGEAVAVFADAVEKTALVEGVEKAETHAFVETGADNNVTKAEDVAGGLEGFENACRVDQRFYHVAAVIEISRMFHVDGYSFISFER
jgi:hypothetical protein